MFVDTFYWLFIEIFSLVLYQKRRQPEKLIQFWVFSSTTFQFFWKTEFEAEKLERTLYSCGRNWYFIVIISATEKIGSVTKSWNCCILLDATVRSCCIQWLELVGHSSCWILLDVTIRSCWTQQLDFIYILLQNLHLHAFSSWIHSNVTLDSVECKSWIKNCILLDTIIGSCWM